MDEQTGTERHILEAHLDANRATVVRKSSGLSWEQATRRLGPSATSVAGVLKHLINVERWWFRHNLDAEDGVPFDWSDDIPDLEFEFGPADSLDSLIVAYEVACAQSRDVAAGYELTDQMNRPESNGNRPSLRWILVHMIEETARHNGHLDIYRELIDGQTDHP
jgi:uncharacterized damage-inducible protein DinB